MSQSISNKQENIKVEDLVTRWNQLTERIEENLKSVNKSLKHSPSQTSLPIGDLIARLKKNVASIEQVYHQINEKIPTKEKMILCLPREKCKAMSCAGLGTFITIVGLFSLGVDGVKDIINVDNKIKWTGFACCMTGAIFSSVKDYLWSNWGNEEVEKRKLLELKAKVSIITHTKTTIRILEKFLQAVSEQENVQQAKWRKTLRKIKRASSKVTAPDEIYTNTFRPLMETLEGEISKRSLRHSQILKVYPQYYLRKNSSSFTLEDSSSRDTLKEFKPPVKDKKEEDFDLEIVVEENAPSFTSKKEESTTSVRSSGELIETEEERN